MSSETVGPYRVRARLGAGGMGEVFLAEDTRLKRKVALKSLSERWAREPEARRRLIHEARAAAALNHPNVAAVYDVLESGDTAYIVMEYVPGESLAQKLLEGALAVDAALWVGVQLCEALAAAHAEGILHRDLKPANLVVTPEGRLKVLDFGLAKSLRVDSSVSADSWSVADPPSDERRIVGTPAYVPPERYEGRAPAESEDVYSAGVVLYELLAGRRPFEGPDLVALAASILAGNPPPLRSVAPGVPADVAAVVERALARRPEDRHPTAAALRSDLEGVRDSAGAPTLPAPRLFARRRRAARPRWAAGVAASVLAVAVAGVAYQSWSRAREAEPRVPVVIVLPLVNATGGPGDEGFGTGVADVLVSALSRVPGVNVLSLAAGQQCARAKRDLACAVGELGADYVLDGSVQRQAERIRVTLSLVRGSSRLVSWSESYDGALDDLFGLQHTVAEGVAGALRLRVPHDAATHVRRIAVGERAFSDYAQALSLLERRDEPASVDRAIGLLEGVVGAEPRFALAQAGLGRAHWARYEDTKDVEHARHAEAALGLALGLDPDLPGVLLVQASVLKTKGQLSSAEAAARRALALQPENDEAHALLGAILAAHGGQEAGLAELRRAIELRPNYWQHHQELGLAELELGRYESAAGSFRRVIDLRPDSVWGHVNLGTALLAGGNAVAARPHFEKAVSIQPDADAYSNLGFIAFGEKHYEDAAGAFGKALALQPDDAGLLRNLADAYARMGRRDDARRLYRRAADRQAAQRQVRPDDAGLLARLAVYEAKAEDAASARRHARRALELGPASPEVAYFCGVAYALAGDRREAVSAIGRALDLGFSVELVRSDDDLGELTRGPELGARLRGTAGDSR